MEKRGQLTLFVIFAILIVIGIIAMFMILPPPGFLTGTSKDPLQEIRPCISKSLLNVLPEYQEKGLYFNPSRTVFYNNENISYHCYTEMKRTICVRNDAQDIYRIQRELRDKIFDDVDQCFLLFKQANRGFDIEIGEMDLSVVILPGKITIRTRRDLSIFREEDVSKYNNFDVSINSPLWDFIRLSNEIINHEVSCDCPSVNCIADISGLNRQSLEYVITFFQGSRDERVYTIRDSIQENEIKFAVKNCDRSPL